MSKLILPITKPCDYEVLVPGSKSIALRQLLISALAEQPTTLIGVPECDDVDAMLDSLGRLGVNYTTLSHNEVHIKPGIDSASDVTLDIRQSGVTLRLLLAIATIRSGKTTYIGHKSLATRPNKPLLDSLQQLGCHVESHAGRLPITIQGPATHRKTSLDASLSSQYLTALLTVGPRLKHGLTVKPIGKVASESYIEITRNELKKRGVDWQVSKDGFVVDHKSYSGGTVSIEGDASGATYHMALATLHGGRVELKNLGSQTLQGDYGFLDICERLGSSVTRNGKTTTVSGPSELEPIDTVDFSAMPDAALTMVGIAPYLNGPVIVEGLETLPYKECDRIECPAIELRKAGLRVETGSDYLKVWPGKPNPTEFDTYDDHRMAMSFAILASNTEGCRIKDPLCVNKTYTGFWRDLALAYG